MYKKIFILLLMFSIFTAPCFSLDRKRKHVTTKKANFIPYNRTPYKGYNQVNSNLMPSGMIKPFNRGWMLKPTYY